MCGCIGVFVILGSAAYLWNALTGKQPADTEMTLIALFFVVGGVVLLYGWWMRQWRWPKR